MKEKYRFVILDDETLEKIRSFKVTKRRVFSLVMLSILAIILATASLLLFTPLRSLVPGYADVERSPQFIRLNQQMERLEATVNAQNNYIAKVQELVTGEEMAPDTNRRVDPQDLATTPIFNLEDILTISPNTDEKSTSKRITPQQTVSDHKLDELYLVAPIKGIVSAGFLKSNKHMGTDIIAPKDTPVKSILSGYVIMADWTLATGYSIGIQHADGLLSFYKHNSALLKTIGDYVNVGEAVAIIGNTGEKTNGPHLHFELWRNGRAINPEDFIDFE